MKDFKTVIEYSNGDDMNGKMVIAIRNDQIICKKIRGCDINFYSLVEYLLSNIEVQRRLIMFSQIDYKRKQYFDIRVEESIYHATDIYLDICDYDLEYVKYSKKLVHISSCDKIESLELWLGDLIEVIAKIKELGYCSTWESDIHEIDTEWKEGTLECSDITTYMPIGKGSPILLAKDKYAKYSTIELVRANTMVVYIQCPSLDGYWSKTIWKYNDTSSGEECVIFARGVIYENYCMEGDEEFVDSLEIERDIQTTLYNKQNWVEK